MIEDLCFEINNRCLNNCKFCSSSASINGKYSISLLDFKRVIDYLLSKSYIKELSISGGEPFIHNDLFEMIEYSKSKGIKTVLFTSGVKFSNIQKDTVNYYINERKKRLKEIEKQEPYNNFLKEKVKEFYNNLINMPDYSYITKDDFKRLKELKLDKIVFDIQSHCYEVDNYLMERSDYMHSCLIKSLVNASFSSIAVDAHFISMKINYKEILDIMEILDNIGSLSILKFIPQGRGKEYKKELLLSEKEMSEFMNLLEIGKKRYNVKVRIGTSLLKENAHKCNAGLGKLDIRYDGTLLLCPAFKDFNKEDLIKYGFNYYNIYENLEEYEPKNGRRLIPLCQKIYK